MNTTAAIIVIIALVLACGGLESYKHYEKHKQDAVQKAYDEDREK